MTRFLPFLLLLALVSAPSPLFAQEGGAAEGAVEAAAAEESAEAPAEEPADPPAEEPAAEPAEEPPAADEPEEAPAPEEPAETADDDEPEADSEPAEEAAEDDAEEEPAEEASDDEASEEEAEADEDAIDWAGVIERFPVFFAVMHRAAVHMPIALWVFGAVFVLIGVVVPSWRNQIPLACLIGGALCSLPAAASGWWVAEHEYGDEWAFGDLTDAERFSEVIVQHRWMAVALVISSVILSIIALVNQKKKSVALGFIWRVGLLALAAAVGWEGHIGGEMTVGEGFFNEAVNEWLGFEYMPTE